MRLEIGYGLRGIGLRLSGAFWTALLLLIAVFVVDTWTTFSAGALARFNDLNPFIRTLSPMGYLASAAGRAVFAVLVLIWIWPEKLQIRFIGCEGWALLLPFAYKDMRLYFGASLVMFIIPVKGVAAWNNIQVLAGRMPILMASHSLGFGLVLGVGLSNLLLYWHYRSGFKSGGAGSESHAPNHK